MKKLVKLLFLGVLVFALTYTVGLLRDIKLLRNDLVRLHVVANSDSSEDQAAKLAVRDAVLEAIQGTVEQFPSAEEARAFLGSHLTDIKAVAEAALKEAGLSHTVTVTLGEESFPTRDYDTFRLPAGIYNTLRLTIGEAQGKNWWCVLFPSLCVPASTEEFEKTAEVMGMPDALNHTLTEKNTGFQIRFFLLDWVGRLENRLFGEPQ